MTARKIAIELARLGVLAILFPALPTIISLRLLEVLVSYCLRNDKRLFIPTQRFAWTIHNLAAHPLSEVLFQLGLKKLGDDFHYVTVPPEAYQEVARG